MKSSILNHIKKNLTGAVTIFTAVCYVLGFFAWNSFLLHYGIFEYAVLPSRFLSAGLLILALPLLLFVLLDDNFWGLFKRNLLFKIFLSVVFSVYLIFFIGCIFPKIPQSFGGARPFSASLIPDIEMLEFFKDVGVLLAKNGDKPEKQTTGLCVFYMNADFLVIGVPKITQPDPTKVDIRIARFLTLDKKRIFGIETGSLIACPPISMLPYFPKPQI